MTTLNELTLTELVGLRERGDLDPAALLDACIARIESREHEVQAFEHVDFERVRHALPDASSSYYGSGLQGIPFGVKDIMDTHDMPTSWGSPIYRGKVALRDAGCVAALRGCGAVAMGKTVSTEFACFNPGKTRNPHNLEHTPGGSSQGSAAAVADFMLPFALGTQTAASVVRPAAFCGVVGYKASLGEFDLGGVCSLSPTLDTLGFFVRDARDLPIIRQAMFSGAAAPRERTPLRVGLVRTPHWDDADPAAREAVERAARDLSGAGAIVEEVSFGPEDGALTEAHKTVMAFEIARARLFEYRHYRDQLSAKMRELVESGLATPRHSYEQAMTLRREWSRRLDGILEGIDCLLAPSTPGEAPRGLDATGDPLFSRMWTLMGVPAVHLPTGKGPAGLPVGIQLLGRWRHDDALIDHAVRVQEILGR